MKVYVAGPYTQGNVTMNVRAAIKVADALAVLGHTPYIPHLTHFWDLISPKPYDWWLRYDAVWLQECDVLLRLPGESNGADLEMKLAEERHMPVVRSIIELEAL